MVGPKGGIQRSFRWALIGLTIFTAVTAIGQDVNARPRLHHRHSPAASENYQPPTASIVVDVNSGAVMEKANADSPRHPASLTKIMTLYLLFEALEAGKLKMASQLPVSTHAAVQAPSKLGLMPGDTISIDTAIRAIITKSANDIAVAVAEAIGGNEANFAKMMTDKARTLGMMHTNYNNASGLPDDAQITTAHDQAILARIIQDRFPQFYHYFSTPSFEFRGVVMRNHNHLLDRVSGVDGMKTGYVRASGYNIITSAHRGQRRIIAVVFGGRTARERDARAVSLIENNINLASIKRTASPVVEGSARAPAVMRTPLPDPRNQTPSGIGPIDEPLVGSIEPIKPQPVKTIIVHSTTMNTASLISISPKSDQLTPTATTPANSPNTVTVTSAIPSPLTDSDPKILDAWTTKTTPAYDDTARQDGIEPNTHNDETKTHNDETKTHNGWMIQIGAFNDEKEAKQHLLSAQNMAKSLLNKADPFTERVGKGEKALYRARFAGLGKGQAQIACRHLKRSDIPCMMLRN